MSKRAGVVVAVNHHPRIGVVRCEDGRHTVFSHDDKRRPCIGDQLGGDFDTEGPTVLQDVATGDEFDAHNHLVGSSASEADGFSS
jgi:hypothetical protein